MWKIHAFYRPKIFIFKFPSRHASLIPSASRHLSDSSMLFSVGLPASGLKFYRDPQGKELVKQMNFRVGSLFESLGVYEFGGIPR